MAIIKTDELSGAVLDWAVGSLETGLIEKDGEFYLSDWEGNLSLFCPSTSGDQGMAIIFREKISIREETNISELGGWYAFKLHPNAVGYAFETCYCWDGGGDNPLEAAMRCFVSSIAGPETEIPDALLKKYKPASPKI